MYQHHRDPDRSNDPILALVRYEQQRRYRQAEHERLLAQLRAARPATTPVLSRLRTWLGARLPAWSRVRQTQAGPATTAELSRAVPGQRRKVLRPGRPQSHPPAGR